MKVQHSQSSSSKCCSSHQSSQKSSSSIASIISKTNLSNTEVQNNDPPTSITKLPTVKHRTKANHTPCKCKCKDEDFKNVERTTYDLEKATCKLLNSVSEIESMKSVAMANTKTECHCKSEVEQNDHTNNNVVQKISRNITEVWSSRETDTSQLNSAINPISLDPFNEVPKIAVVPPTPDGILSCNSQLWKNEKTIQFEYDSNKKHTEVSPEDSPIDEDLPYRSFNTTLKRYGTLPSLEKMTSEDTDDRTYNSSETEENDDDDDDDGIK